MEGLEGGREDRILLALMTFLKHTCAGYRTSEFPQNSGPSAEVGGR